MATSSNSIAFDSDRQGTQKVAVQPPSLSTEPSGIMCKHNAIFVSILGIIKSMYHLMGIA